MIKPVDSNELAQARIEGFIAYNEGAEFLVQRALGNGQEITMRPMGFGNLRVMLGPSGGETWDRGFCFSDHTAAWKMALGWDGEGDPEGWHRCLTTGRRRPDGDRTREYINP